MRLVRVAIVDGHEIYRRGLRSALVDRPQVEVVCDAEAGPVPVEVDVAIMSVSALRDAELGTPVVVCTDGGEGLVDLGPPARAVVPRGSLTPEQLAAAVRAVAEGFTLDAPTRAVEPSIDERSRQVLTMLAQGAQTREISTELGYSERTIKAVISDLERRLEARSRAQAVAEGIRQGLI